MVSRLVPVALGAAAVGALVVCWPWLSAQTLAAPTASAATPAAPATAITVDGEVFDLSLRAQGDVPVAVVHRAADGGEVALQRTWSDEAGRFRLELPVTLPADAALVAGGGWFEPESRSLAAAGYPLAPGHRFVLRRRVSLDGCMRDTDGAPVASVRLRATGTASGWDGLATAWSRWDGTFTLMVPATGAFVVEGRRAEAAEEDAAAIRAEFAALPPAPVELRLPR